MTPDEVRTRTRRFALAIIRLVETLPRTRAADVLGRQLAKSGTSVGANYRAACRARSRSEFVAKLGIVEEEADESAYWLELLADAKLAPVDQISPLRDEANEILAITIASIRTARRDDAAPRLESS
jgi:four helix bundle protein